MLYIILKYFSKKIKELISAIRVTKSTFMIYLRKIRKIYRKFAAKLSIFAISLKDVNKALYMKRLFLEEKLKERISLKFHNLFLLFIKKEADKLNFYKLGVNHKINLKIDKK